ncbi:hypothetical protein [Rhodococcus sp. KRD175]|uniref:hypothetical protein n=1 Tax=Rhodococcus sp. KRD175 TaxID=2729729 RepID=UPI0019D1F397|nr:hypothetical protein [Rhodococcus sp. KRD175]
MADGQDAGVAIVSEIIRQRFDFREFVIGLLCVDGMPPIAADNAVQVRANSRVIVDRQ